MIWTGALLAMAIMATCCWASNLLPGRSLLGAAAARAAWWGLPIGLVVFLQGVAWDHAAILAAMGWVGAWLPHGRLPDPTLHWPVLLGDIAIKVMLVAGLLFPLAATFWVCGAFWYWMVVAGALWLPLCGLAQAVRVNLPGLRDGEQRTGVLFGAELGLFLVLAVWTPTPAPDLLP